MSLAIRPYCGPGRALAKADYAYDVTPDYIVVIEDLDLGSTSVTNDIENVLADIIRQQGLPSLAGYRVIYRDSLKNWDEVRLRPDGHFQDFRTLGGCTPTEAEALAKLRANRQR